MLSCFRHIWLFTTPWTVAHQASLSWDSPGKNTAVGCHAFLQRIFPTQGSNPGTLHLLHYRWIPYHWAIRKALSKQIPLVKIINIISLFLSGNWQMFCQFHSFKIFFCLFVLQISPIRLFPYATLPLNSPVLWPEISSLGSPIPSIPSQNSTAVYLLCY